MSGQDKDRVLAEAGVLGVLIWLPDFAGPRLEKVCAEDFRDGRHRVIFEAVYSLHAGNRPADLAEVLEWLIEKGLLEAAGGPGYLRQIVDTARYAGAHQFEGYVKALKERGGEGVEVFTEEREGREKGSSTGGSRENGGEQRAEEREASMSLVTSAATIGKGAELLEELREFFRRHVVLPPHGTEVLALWTLHTYAWRLRSVTTYLAIVSPEKRCGKTTLLTLLNQVVNRPQFASNISPPAIFRAIEETQPTLLIDEADTFLGAKDELRGILNAGYTRDSAYVLRATGEGQKLQRFSCWCPKVIATIESLPETLADRCVIIAMRRKMAGEKCERLKNFDGSDLHNRCQRWVEENSQVIERSEPAIPETLNDRAGDIWEPLLALADLAGGEWPELARSAAVHSSALGADHDFTSQLLGDIEMIFSVFETDKIFSRQLVEALTRMTERPWRELRRGGPINELWLAQHLRPFGIESRAVRLGDAVAKGYYLGDFRDAFARYLAKAA